MSINQSQIQSIYTFFQQETNASLAFCIKLESGLAGPDRIFSLALHGNEPCGAIAGYEIINDIRSEKIELSSGSATFILSNPEAFLKQERLVDFNLNRIFNTQDDDVFVMSGDSYEYGRASQIREYLTNNKFDSFVDIHSLSASDDRMVMVFFSNQYDFEDDGNQKTLKIDRDLKNNISFAVSHSSIKNYVITRGYEESNSLADGFVKRLMTKRGLPANTFLVECGQHYSKNSVKYAKEVILNNLQSDLKFDNFTDYDKLDIYTLSATIYNKPSFKWVNSNINSYDYVTTDTPIATYLEDGEVKNYYPPFDSKILMPTLQHIIKPNDLDNAYLISKVNIK